MNDSAPSSKISADARSSDPQQRLNALRQMRSLIAEGKKPDWFFHIARELVGDSNNDCRWQACIVISEFLMEYPDELWAIALHYGTDDDEDMRDAIATVILEHLLEMHRSRYLPLAHLAADANPLFADTLQRCWWFGDGDSGGQNRS